MMEIEGNNSNATGKGRKFAIVITLCFIVSVMVMKSVTPNLNSIQKYVQDKHSNFGIAVVAANTTSTNTTTAANPTIATTTNPIRPKNEIDDFEEGDVDPTQSSSLVSQLPTKQQSPQPQPKHLFSIENLDLTKNILCGDAKCYIQAKPGILQTSSSHSNSASPATKGIDSVHSHENDDGVGFLVMQDEFLVNQISPSRLNTRPKKDSKRGLPVIDIWRKTYRLGELIQSHTGNTQHHIMISPPFAIESSIYNPIDEIIKQIVARNNTNDNNTNDATTTTTNNTRHAVVPQFVRGSTKEPIRLDIVQKRYMPETGIVVQMVKHLHPMKYVLFGCTTGKLTQFWSKIDQVVKHVTTQQSKQGEENRRQHQQQKEQLISALDAFRRNFRNIMTLMFSSNSTTKELACVINDFQIFVNIDFSSQQIQDHQERISSEIQPQQHFNHQPGQILHFDLDRCYCDRNGFYNRNGKISPPVKYTKDKLRTCYKTTNERLLQYIQNITAVIDTDGIHNNITTVQ